MLSTCYISLHDYDSGIEPKCCFFFLLSCNKPKRDSTIDSNSRSRFFHDLSLALIERLKVVWKWLITTFFVIRQL